MPQLTKLQRAIISRSAAALLAFGFLFGGYQCLRKGHDLGRAYRAQVRQGVRPDAKPPTGSGPGAAVANLAGIVLMLAGGMFALVAVLPAETFARIMGPPTNTTLYDNPGLDRTRRWFQ